MIDFIKAIIQDIDIALLKQNKLLNFCSEVNLETGEVRKNNRNNTKRSTYCNAFYNSLEFRIYDSGKVFLLGSLHKYYNKGEHNFNDFGIHELNEVLKDIKDKFNITPQQLKINQIEIGLNINPPYPTNRILKHCFRHGKESFKEVAVSNKGKYMQAEYQQYYIKIYNKAQQHKNQGFDVGSDEILRFEIKYRKLERLKKYKIRTLQNVLESGLDSLAKELLEEWNKLLLFDWTIASRSKLLLKYCNPLFWDEVIANQSLYKKHKRIFKDLIYKHSENISLQIRKVMEDKVDKLLYKGIRFNQYCKTPIQKKGIHINPLYIPLKQNQVMIRTRQCKITNLDISMQKDNSKFLSHAGLKYYYQNDRDTFNLIKNKYLSKRWMYTDIDKQIKELAHNIRNKANNLRRQQRNLYPRKQLNLFDIGITDTLVP